MGRREAVQPSAVSTAKRGQPQASAKLTMAIKASGGIARRGSGGSNALQSPARSQAGMSMRRSVRSWSQMALMVSV